MKGRSKSLSCLAKTSAKTSAKAFAKTSAKTKAFANTLPTTTTTAAATATTTTTTTTTTASIDYHTLVEQLLYTAKGLGTHAGILEAYILALKNKTQRNTLSLYEELAMLDNARASIFAARTIDEKVDIIEGLPEEHQEPYHKYMSIVAFALNSLPAS